MIRTFLVFVMLISVLAAQASEPTRQEVLDAVSLAREMAAEAKATDAALERALLRQKLRAYEGAVEDYSKVLKKIPGHAVALSGRGDCLLLLGRLEEALADFKTLEAGVHFQVANACLRLGRSDEAERAIMRCVELAPEDGLYRRYLGYVSFALGDWERAIIELRKSIAQPRGNNRYGHLVLHLALARAGRVNESELESLVKTWAEPQTLALAGTLLGTTTEAEVLKVARVASLDSEKADRLGEAAYYLGAKHLMQGDPSVARVWFERATRGSSKAVIEYALARYDLQRLDQP